MKGIGRWQSTGLGYTESLDEDELQSDLIYEWRSKKFCAFCKAIISVKPSVSIVRRESNGKSDFCVGGSRDIIVGVE